MPSASSPPTKWAVVLVHGVGDSRQGQMLDRVSTCMAQTNSSLSLESHCELAKHTERPGPNGVADEYDVHMRRGKIGRSGILFAEVYWADLTRPGVETHALIAAVVWCVYGIRHIALQASRIPSRGGRLIHDILRVSIFIMQGPVYALYLFELLLSILYLVFAVPGTIRTTRAGRPCSQSPCSRSLSVQSASGGGGCNDDGGRTRSCGPRCSSWRWRRSSTFCCGPTMASTRLIKPYFRN